MADVPQVELTNDPITSWAAKVNKKLEGNTLSTSSDLIVKKTGSGTTIQLNPLLRTGTDNMRYTRDEFDPSLGYGIHQVIRVLPNKTYTDINGDDIPATPGVWICVAVVPSLWFTNSFKGNKDDFLRYVRQDDVKYYPRLDKDGKEPSSFATLDDPDGCYWQYLGGLPIVMVSCDNGIEQKHFIDGSKVPEDEE